MDNELSKIYYTVDRPEAYTGAANILRTTNKVYHPQDVFKWLESQDTFNQHRYVRRRFPRRHYNVRS